MNTTDIKSFNYLENGDIQYSMLDTIKTTQILEAGSYQLEYVHSYTNPKLEFKVIEFDELHEPIKFHFIPKLEEIFSKFFQPNIKDKINSLGYLHKMGIMLYGKQGGSKSSIFNYYADKLIKEHNAIYFYIKGNYIGEPWDFIKKIRKIQDNPIIIFLDECDKFFPHAENEIKPMLDGNESIDNCICFFATNYLDKIPSTIVDRPSRIKFKYEVESIDNEEAIFKLLDKALNSILSTDEIQKAVQDNLGKTIDEIKDYIQDVIMDINFDKVKTKKIGFKK